MAHAKWSGADVRALREALNCKGWQGMQKFASLVEVSLATVYNWERRGPRYPRHIARLTQLRRTLELQDERNGHALPFRLTRRPERRRRPSPAGSRAS